MRSQTTCSVSLFSSVHILTVGLRGVGLSEVDCSIKWNYFNMTNLHCGLLVMWVVGSLLSTPDVLYRTPREFQTDSSNLVSPWSGLRTPYVPSSHHSYGGVRNIRPPGPLGPYHICGEFGHLKYACTKPKPSAIQYPFMGAHWEEGCVLHGTSIVKECDEGMLSSASNLEEGPLVLLEGYSEKMGYPCVKGRLQASLDYWIYVIKAPDAIVSIIRQGYILPFVSVPEGKQFRNRNSTIVNHVGHL